MPGPPVPPREPFEHVAHGLRRPDPYHWMRRLDVGTLAHLAAERDWYDASTGHLSPFVRKLRAEMTGRVPATDSSISWPQHGYSYYTVLPEGREYVQLLRRRHAAEDDTGPELLLDVNELASGGDYVELGQWKVSPDAAVLAYSVDLSGDEVYELRFRDLASGRELTDVVPRSAYGGAWSADSAYFFYTVHDELWRQHQVWRHRLGSPVASDELVMEEPDEKFELMVRTTRSGEQVVIWSECRDTSEVWVVPAAAPTAPARSVGGRRRGVEYHAEHCVLPDGSSRLLVVTNDGEPEFRLMAAPVPVDADQDHTAWTPVRDPVPGERLESVEAFASHVVLVSRAEGHSRLRIVPVSAPTSEGLVVDPAFDCGSVSVSRNEEFSADHVVVADESYLHPPVWSAVSFGSGARTELLRKEAPGFDPAAYVAEQRTFPSVDGTPVPATILRHVETALDGTAPCVMYAYGAYEAVYPDQEWDPAIPSLLDRGVVYVHAHVRGGGEGGRRWWLDGRLEHKQHTFDDHVAVADGLAAAGLVDGTRIATRGLSAGGLLQGAVFSQRPDRWRAVVAEVPFVDVVTTMLDPSIPLTVNEWDEWGDPSRPEDYAWMLRYSPYDNLPAPGGRPALLVTGAVHDARVMVWEPAKWVAALRESDRDWGPGCLFRVELGAGAHVGPSGRFAHLAYEAEVYAWLLDKLDAIPR
ncbi:MAG TPA: prolyl oligopeptidase family serine peptidase [Nocardioides sp.]|uniref:prolyl oligopeptidase family serine peptidase n=1 Tax=Nocardioides sp. TaxID=35761 RepID=UPI002E36E5CA|nr:prolyl oligopeptidase family serine peptidase [Nocardioides sp.]HEX5087352.1 prolyl oligopeptidase family serine peptidase [Nocardioides sp.]